MESGDLWVGGQFKHLKGKAEGSCLLTVLVPDGPLVGFSSLRTFLLITLEARVRCWVMPVLKDIWMLTLSERFDTTRKTGLWPEWKEVCSRFICVLFSALPLEAGQGHLQRQHLEQLWETCFHSIRSTYTSPFQLFCFTNTMYNKNQYLLSDDSTLIMQRALRLELSLSSRTALLSII